LKLGIAAFIDGTDDEDVENVVRSISTRSQIPFIETHWKKFHRPPDPYSVNIYPDPSLLAQASIYYITYTFQIENKNYYTILYYDTISVGHQLSKASTPLITRFYFL
jgi:hypothetical protein